MIKSVSVLSALIGFVLLLVPNSWCTEYAPFVVKIVSYDQFQCTGVLVKGNFVLTSAKCVKDVAPLSLQVITLDDQEIGLDVKSRVTDLFIPRNYASSARFMDVALLKLETPLDFGGLEPAKLCTKSFIGNGTEMTLYNFGIVPEGYSISAENIPLLITKVVVSDPDVCSRWYEKKHLGTTLCAADTSQSHCFHDISGPAVVDGEVCAFYNYNIGCMVKHHPGVFTSLADPSIKEFIEETLQK